MIPGALYKMLFSVSFGSLIGEGHYIAKGKPFILLGIKKERHSTNIEILYEGRVLRRRTELDYRAWFERVDDDAV